MIHEMLGLAILFLAEPDVCIEDRASFLSMSRDDFDKDLEGGWRPIAQRDGCMAAAADLIAEYRRVNADALNEDGRLSLLWHEGQLRAAMEEREAAIALMRRTYRNREELHHRARDLYVAGTIAFLEGDREALIAARDALAALPAPDWYAEAAAQVKAEHGVDLVWPENLEFLDSFIRCFDRPYEEAYSPTCGL